jgi:2-polyprenyl-6-methoxyphenol hydroxylase-like FAD-dependent oxidoreductase
VERTQVLIVGGGPTGLALACQLSRFGVRARVVEALAQPQPHSRAIGIQARTLELLAGLEVTDELCARGVKVRAINAYADGRRILHVSLDGLDSPYPFVLALPQCETERILAERLRALGGTVERGVRVAELAQDADGVTATLEGAGTVRADWVIGCDGAHSTVRHALGLEFVGAAYPESFLLADVRIDWELAKEEPHSFLAPEGPLIAIPLPGERRYRLVAEVGRDAPPTEPTLADVEALLGARCHVAARLCDPGWLASFHIHRRIVSRYRVGRVFLAGDAAHIHSPVGGQGMNTGIQDALNLGWKLGLCVRGRGRDLLLDSYEPERRPVAAATIQGTDWATRVVTLRNPVPRWLRDQLARVLASFPPVEQRIARAAAELDVAYGKSPIVAEQCGLSAGGLATGARVPDLAIVRAGRTERLHQLLRSPQHVLLLCGQDSAALDAIAAQASQASQLESIVVGERLFGAHRDALYLIRPDGYVGFRALPPAWQPLRAHLDRCLA